MGLEIVRRIRGNVHGTIDVTALEDAVLDHEYLQRLRRIRQLAFLHYVFPGATHSRFEHSLGVMHLAGVAWDKLKVNQRRIFENSQSLSDFTRLESNGERCYGKLAPTFPVMSQVFDSDYNLQVLRLAGLMHDLGHPPFSHSGERFLPSWRQVHAKNSQAPGYLMAWIEERCDALAGNGIDPYAVRARHEVFSLLCVHKIVEDTYQRFPSLRMRIDPRDIIAVLCPEIAPASQSPLRANGVYRMLNELISGELDIDRMDYLLRDSRECGVVYGVFEAGRILDGLCIYHDPGDKGLHVAISSNGLAAFEDYLRARQSMYMQVYFHKTSGAAEAMMQHLTAQLDGWTLPANIVAYCSLDEYNIGDSLLERGQNITDYRARSNFEVELRNLLYQRRLWKRVFEWSGPKDDIAAEKRLAVVEGLLRDLGVDYQRVSSTSAMTRFRPRRRDDASMSHLRLIKRDEFDIPRVKPIEDFLGVLQDPQKISIHRVYVRGAYLGGETAVDAIKKQINARLSAAKNAR